MIDIVYQASEKRSLAIDSNKAVGECTYSDANGVWVINHTFVLPEYEGQGIAKRLVEKLVDHVRQEEGKLSATCPYALALFKRSRDYDDVVVWPKG